MDRHYVLSPESSASPGKWRTRPDQREIVDAIGDMSIREVTLMKSARYGATLIKCGALMRWIDADPRTILMVQPTVKGGEAWSKKFLAAMIRDNPRLTGKIGDGTKQRDRTILSKDFPGGTLTIVGANSGAGFRMLSCNVILRDEVDAYPPSAGTDGDPSKLAEKRSADYWDAHLVSISTPKIAGQSRIEQMFLDGDQRRYHVPCPQCEHVDILVFSRKKSTGQGEFRGHYMQWPEGEPEKAFFVCRKNGCVIEERGKRWMMENGQWIADAEFKGHASFHVWAAYSTSAAASWGQIAKEWLEAQGKPDQLQVFVNTVLGETWVEQGDAPDWEHLYARRQPYRRGTVPDGVRFLTCGVDVQRDRFYYEVVGWDLRKRSWSIDAGELFGDTADQKSYRMLDQLLAASYPRTLTESSTANLARLTPALPIARLAIDSGDGSRTHDVYDWVRRYPVTRVMACRGGGPDVYAMVKSPRAVDVKRSGRVIKGGCRVWTTGTHVAKKELYGWLGLRDGGGPKPNGWCTFPEYEPEYFKQLTAEHLVTTKNKKGFTVREWKIKPGRENHYLDARILARVAAYAEGLDRVALPSEQANADSTQGAPEPARAQARKPRPKQPRKQGGFMGRRGGYAGRR
jgi:phage terminase large subunit GpA-like protein